MATAAGQIFKNFPKSCLKKKTQTCGNVRRYEQRRARRVQILEGDEALGADWARGGEAARGGLKGGVAREDVGDSEACMVWAMPPLPAACLAHIGALGLGAFAEDKAEEYVDTEEEEGSNEGEVDKKQRPTNRHVMDIHGQTLRTDRRSRFDCNATYLLSFFKPFDLNTYSCGRCRNHKTEQAPRLPFQYDFNMSDKVGAIWISYGCQRVEGWNSGCREKLATSWRNCGTSFYKMWTSAGRSSWRQRDGTLAVYNKEVPACLQRLDEAMALGWPSLGIRPSKPSTTVDHTMSLVTAL
ncbi:hypothetical protein C8J57DRAFT_1221428 [Mycena rebaudengoi]|nr:hypothetical protein C8J57DRAFT_1221428 [Mycena rebaudengoi]